MARISFLGMMAAAKVVPVRVYCTAAAATGRELMVIEPKAQARKRTIVRRGLGFSLMGLGGLAITCYSTTIQAKAHRLNVNQSFLEDARAVKAEARAELDEARADRYEKRAERADARAERAEARADRDEARADRAETRAVEAAAAAQQGWFGGWGKNKEKKGN